MVISLEAYIQGVKDELREKKGRLITVHGSRLMINGPLLVND